MCIMFEKDHYFLQRAAQPPVPPCKEGRRGLDGGGRRREAVLFLGQTQRCLGLRMSPFQDNDLLESCHRLKASIKHHALPLCLSMSATFVFIFYLFFTDSFSHFLSLSLTLYFHSQWLSPSLLLSVVNSSNLNPQFITDKTRRAPPTKCRRQQNQTTRDKHSYKLKEDF